MSTREIDRASVMRMVSERRVTKRKAASLLSIS